MSEESKKRHRDTGEIRMRPRRHGYTRVTFCIYFKTSYCVHCQVLSHHYFLKYQISKYSIHFPYWTF